MFNFIISSLITITIMFASFFIFKSIIPGNVRHKLYEKFMSSFAKFIIYIFLITVVINATTAYIFYKARYVAYLNVIAPIIVSILVGFIASTVPTRGEGDKTKFQL